MQLPAEVISTVVLMLHCWGPEPAWHPEPGDDRGRGEVPLMLRHQLRSGGDWTPADEAAAAMVVFDRALGRAGARDDTVAQLRLRRVVAETVDRGDFESICIREWINFGVPEQVLVHIETQRQRRRHERSSPPTGARAYWRRAREQERKVRRRCLARLWLRAAGSLSIGEGNWDPADWLVPGASFLREAELLHGRFEIDDGRNRHADLVGRMIDSLLRRSWRAAAGPGVRLGEADHPGPVTALPPDVLARVVGMLQLRPAGVALCNLRGGDDGDAWREVNEVAAALEVLHGPLRGQPALLALRDEMDVRREMLPDEPEHREAQWLNENMASSWGRHVVDEYIEGVQLRRTNERRSPSAGRAAYWATAVHRETVEARRNEARHFLTNIAEIASESPQAVGYVREILVGESANRARAAGADRREENFGDQDGAAAAGPG